jgi:hypothetical protein
MSQQPKHNDATEHEPLVSETLKESAEENRSAARETRKQTRHIAEVEERLHRRLDEKSRDG